MNAQGTTVRSALAEATRSIRNAAAGALALGVFANLAALTLPLYSMQVYDRVLMSRNITTLLMLTVIAVFMLGVQAALDAFRSAILARCGIAIERLLSIDVFDGALRVFCSPDDDRMQKVRIVREFISSGLAAFLDLPWVPLFIILTFAMHPLLGLVALAGVALTLVAAAATEALTREQVSTAARQGSEAERRLAGMMRDPGTIAALGMRGAMRTLWMRRNDSALISQAAASHRATELLAVAKFLRMSVQIAVMSVAAYLVVEKAIQPGMIFAASLLIGRVLAPVEQAVGSWRRFVAARHAFTSLKPLLSAAPEGERIDLPAPTGRIGVERLQVAHPGAAEPVLKEVSFALEDGETLLIVGPSGTGKSTLLRALLGIQPPSSGAVRLDGAALAQHDPECLGRHLGYVAQNVVLFEGTVAQNIARFRVADPDGVIAAAQAADAHEAILRLPRGYETEVGPAGEWLSGGMRQRIALARALYGDPALMVLDEPAFEADPAGDQALLRVLKQLKAEGKTVVVASHKTLLIPAADKILVLGNGAVQAFGPRDEILQKALRPRVVAASGMVAAPTGLAESRGEQAGTMGGQPDLRTVM